MERKGLAVRTILTAKSRQLPKRFIKLRQGGLMKKIILFFVSILLTVITALPTQGSFKYPGELTLESCRQFGNNSFSDPVRYEDAGHIEDWSKFLKPSGTIKTVVIPIDFSDVPSKTPISKIIQNMDSVSAEIERLSSGKTRLEVTVLSDWVRMPVTAKSYMATTDWAWKVRDAIKASDGLVNYQEFDLVLFKVDETNLIVNVAGALPSWTEYLPDGLTVMRGAFLGTDYWTTIGQSVQMSVHEILHVFGLPDLYMPNPNGDAPVGMYDLMSSFNPEHQVRLLGWNKWKLGWIDDVSVTCFDSTTPLMLEFKSTEDENSLRVLRYGSSLVMVIERFLDAESPNKVKILAYTVDTKRYVWQSGGPSGKVSPIQMIRPEGYKKFPCTHCEWNLGISMAGGQAFETTLLRAETRTVGKSLFVRISPHELSPIPFPQIRTLTNFAGNSTTLSSRQKAEIRDVLAKSDGNTKFICTGIRYYNQPLSENIKVRARAKAACDYAKSINPNFSYWYQTKTTQGRSYNGQVMVVSKG